MKILIFLKKYAIRKRKIGISRVPIEGLHLPDRQIQSSDPSQDQPLVQLLLPFSLYIVCGVEKNIGQETSFVISWKNYNHALWMHN